MSQTANITIYLQAVGGHFLGAHAYDAANIKLKFSYSGGDVEVPYAITTNFTDDGNTSSNFTNGASTFMPIITIPQPAPAAQVATVNFLSADFTTIAGRTTIVLPETIEFADISVSIPTTLGKPFLLSQQIILNPAQPDYQVIIPVAGLFLSPADVTGSIAVAVKMMCGCPVTEGPPASLWPANDFMVLANVLDITGVTTPYTLAYTANQTGNSVFSALLLPNQAQITLVTFTAVQKSTGNYGVVVWAAS
jgi:hypothetical protein